MGLAMPVTSRTCAPPASISMPSLFPGHGLRASRALRLVCRWHWPHTCRSGSFMKARSCCRQESIGRRIRISKIGGAKSGGLRRPLGTLPANCIGLFSPARPRQRIFPYEVSIIYDFCPMVVPWAFEDVARDVWVKWLTEDILASDVVLSISQSTKADAGRFSSLDPERIVVRRRGRASAWRPIAMAGRSRVGPDRTGGFDDRAAEERQLLVRLVSADETAAARDGAVVGGETRLDDLAR